MRSTMMKYHKLFDMKYSDTTIGTQRVQIYPWNSLLLVKLQAAFQI